MKKSFILLGLIILPIVCSAQSDSLKAAYNKVVQTIRDYKFTSEDVGYHDFAKTKSITFKLQDGYFVFVLNDSFGPFSDPIHGFRPGMKTVKVTIKDAYFGNDYDYSLAMGCRDGVELTYKGKKELLEDYSLCGERLSLNKLRKELKELQSIAISENFMGTLDASKSSTKKATQTKPKQKSPQKTATSTQQQQRQRKRISAGN